MYNKNAHELTDFNGCSYTVYLKQQPLISLDNRLVPLDDIRKGQLPTVAEQHWDTGRLGTGRQERRTH